jgi:N-methylhydantoinase A
MGLWPTRLLVAPPMEGVVSTRIGIDVGGTFTDFVLVDGRRRHIAKEKYSTTPHDPSVGVLEGLDILLRRHDLSLAEVGHIVHGTTLVANAIIERKGARVGLLATSGFRDAVEIRREVRFDMYDLGLEFPEPLVPRHLRRGVRERIGADGDVIDAVDLEQARAEVEKLAHEGVTALAVCFLHSYANSIHEERVKAFLGREFPYLYVSISSEIAPSMGEYERTSTAVVNAYVQPLVQRYLRHLEEGLRQRGFTGDLYLMTSAGGTITAETAAQYPVLLLESGPVAGALMSQYLGRLAAVPNLLAFDMGGTTAKGCVIKGGTVRKEYSIEVARAYQYKKGSGFPLMIPSVQLIEIGVGGGSIAAVDALHRLRVGPESAGAEPGPACYGRGGILPTVTDADVLLGYLNPEFFLGGEMALDVEAARRAVQRGVGEPLGMGLVEAAAGIHEVANEQVARAFRLHAAEAGVDIRGHELVAFGGAGPVHALGVARKLAVRRVVVPWGAGVYSAFGLLVTPLGFDAAQTLIQPLAELDPTSLAKRFAGLEARAIDMLSRARLAPHEVTLRRSADLRYRGQGYTVQVTADGLDPTAPLDDLERRFVAAYTQLYGVAPTNAPVEIVQWKVTGTGPVEDLDPRLARDATTAGTALRSSHAEGTPQAPALKARRAIYIPEESGFHASPIYDRYRLAPGDVVHGPAVIEERESSLVLFPGNVGRVDEHLNIVVTVSPGDA